MSRVADDPGNYFQTTDSIATSQRKAAKAKNKHGHPIKLPSKLLAVIVDPEHDNSVYVAEAAGEVKRVNVDTGDVQRIFSQATAPVTCLAVSQQTNTLLAGCWDEKIYAINLRSRKCEKQSTGHTDFVKCLVTASIDGRAMLISGGADAAIIVWDIESGKQLHKLKGHTKSIQHLTIDPISSSDNSSGSLVLFSASSDPEIRQWHVSLNSAHELVASVEKPIRAHDTSVYSLLFDSEGDLWTASADKTAKNLVRDRGWEADTVLQHPDFVRDVTVSEGLGLVVTACRDEDVRVWDAASGDLLFTYSGHFEEVTGLVQLGQHVISVSIDCTVRKWGLSRADMAKYQEEAERENQGDASKEEGIGGGSLLTAEEEAELAELMDEDD